MKLKTLKDLETEHEKYSYEDSLVTGDELRQEAIKHIKELRSGKLINIGYDEILKYKVKVISIDKPMGKVEVFHIVTWIKHFFNITEEDLK